jgi:uncharacterized protein YqcC (DUF446 family)
MSITVMKQALETLETATHQWEKEKAITSLRQAIAEAEKQEPVAWRNAAIRVGEDLCSVGPFGYYDMTAEQWLDWALSVVTVHANPQPKCEWVGLTVDEMAICIDEPAWDLVLRKAEQILKEKNA